MKKLIAILLCMYQVHAICQEKAENSAASFSLNADVVSRYVWRGLLYSPNVNVQPYAAFSYKGLSLSTWASYGISDRYAEVDFTLSYAIDNLSVSVNDYYNEFEDSLGTNRHFNFKDNTTPHALEATLSYKISETMPLTLSLSSFFYGNDKDSEGENMYSSYIEASYPFDFSNYSFNLFIGGTLDKGLYADKAAIVNVGFSATRQIKVSDSFQLPFSASLISNPYAEDIFIVLKLSF